MLTGIPELDNQFSGVRVSSEVRVQSYPDSTLRIQMENIKLKEINLFRILLIFINKKKYKKESKSQPD